MIHVRHVLPAPELSVECDLPPIEEQWIITIDKNSIGRFTTAINRALNCWDEAHPELKQLGDMLTHGHILQNYYKQRSDAP